MRPANIPQWFSTSNAFSSRYHIIHGQHHPSRRVTRATGALNHKTGYLHHPSQHIQATGAPNFTCALHQASLYHKAGYLRSDPAHDPHLASCLQHTVILQHLDLVPSPKHQAHSTNSPLWHVVPTNKITRLAVNTA